MSALSRNQRYLLDTFEATGATCGLDYGCGDGQLVAAATMRGHDFWGTDLYYGREDFQEQSLTRAPAAAHTRIKLLGPTNVIPWPSQTFDWVCSGQVMEHVHELDLVAAEIARVTKPGGLGLHTFPTQEALMEQHLGVPLYHRIPSGMRRTWAQGWYRVGVASKFDMPDFRTWWPVMSRFFDDDVVLRHYAAIEDAFSPFFTIRDVSIEKLAYHLKARIPNVALLRWAERRRHGVALLMTRRADE